MGSHRGVLVCGDVLGPLGDLAAADVWISLCV